VNIIKEILNTTTQLNNFIKKEIKMNIKIIEVNECINKISENLDNISNSLNKYIQDFQDEKEKYLNFFKDDII